MSENTNNTEKKEGNVLAGFVLYKDANMDWARFGQLYGEWKSKSITGRDFMRRMDMSANTFYRRVREYEITHGITEQTSA